MVQENPGGDVSRPTLSSTSVSIHTLDNDRTLLGVTQHWSCGCVVSTFCEPDELHEVMDFMVSRVHEHHGIEDD